MISDPDYARIFTKARCIGWSQGYTVVLHGTATRDLGILAIPWAVEACDPKHLVDRIADACSLTVTGSVRDTPTRKPHGRLTWTLVFKSFNDPRFVDLSIMPRIEEKLG